MLLQKLDELGVRVLLTLEEILGRVLAALWLRAVLNPRMTAAGVVSGVVFCAAHYGLRLTNGQQTALAMFIIFAIGAAGGDSHHRRNI